jgi:hypothetical protein
VGGPAADGEHDGGRSREGNQGGKREDLTARSASRLHGSAGEVGEGMQVESGQDAAWTVEHDRELWARLGHLPRTACGNVSIASGVGALVRQLATQFVRTEGAILSRLKHLGDPTHVAHARLHGPPLSAEPGRGGLQANGSSHLPSGSKSERPDILAEIDEAVKSSAIISKLQVSVGAVYNALKVVTLQRASRGLVKLWGAMRMHRLIELSPVDNSEGASSQTFGGSQVYVLFRMVLLMVVCVCVCVCVCVWYTHKRTHARTHVRTHALTHACMHARTHARTHACMHARTLARTHARTHHAHTQHMYMECTDARDMQRPLVKCATCPVLSAIYKDLEVRSV